MDFATSHYRQLHHGDHHHHESIEDWVRFFLKVCLKQAKEADDIVSGKNLEAILLQNQYQIYQIASNFDEFAIKDIEKNTGIPRPTIRQAIDKLCKLGIIESIGAGRGARYRFIKINRPE